MVFPVLSVFADSYFFSTPFLIGVTLGIYGLTNALMQIPFGVLSINMEGKKNHINWIINFFHRIIDLLCDK